MKVYESVPDCPKYWVAKYCRSDDVMIDTASKSLYECRKYYEATRQSMRDNEVVFIKVQIVPILRGE